MDAETGSDVSAREVRDLRNTISALRDSVERMRIERDKLVQEAVAASHQEVAQLKATTAALRVNGETRQCQNGQKQNSSLHNLNSEQSEI